MPVATPSVDLVEIGAGGGSIARVGPTGILDVGPDSAGADPGPICYGRGGSDVTVTDADLVLGYLDPAFFLGGTMALDDDQAALAVLDAEVASRLGLSPIERPGASTRSSPRTWPRLRGSTSPSVAAT